MNLPSAPSLPKGWAATTLSQVAQWGSGGTPSRKNADFFKGTIPWVKTGELGSKYICTSGERITPEAIERSSAKIFPAGSIGIAMYGATIGKLSIWASDLSTNQACAVAQPHRDLLGSEFLYYFLLSQKLSLIDKGKGGAQPNISQSILKSYAICLPPINEQRRIVAKIEELFSELDKGIESLKAARAQLKVYRQAVLKHAFEGKLTAQWREENKDKLETAEQLLAGIRRERATRYFQQLKHWKVAVKDWEKTGKSRKKPTKPKKPLDTFDYPDKFIGKLPQLPEGWTWVRVGDICEVVRGGSPRPAGDARYYGGSIPFLKVADLTRTAGAYVDTHSFSITQAGLQKTRLVDPPILMLSNSGATLGVPKICRIRTTFNDGIAAFLGIEETDLPYHYYYWASKTTELRSIKQGAAQPNLNTGLIQDIMIPMCSREEMQIVARHIEKSLSIFDQMGATIDCQLGGSQALRQSILKDAFSGELVKQDPNDEPAAVLLERIKAENASQMPRTRTRKPKVANA